MKNIFGKIIRRCARRYLRTHTPYVIGITGSVGKTSCRMTLTQVLTQMLPDVRISTSPKNFNSDIWIALAVLDIRSFTPSMFGVIWALWKAIPRAFWLGWLSGSGSSMYDVLVLEYGIDGPGDMDILLEVCVPQVAIFTWLDKVHSVAFESVDEILTEKSKLLTSSTDLTLVPVSAAGGYMRDVIEHISTREVWHSDILTYALRNERDADIWYEWLDLSLDTWGRLLSTFEIEQWRTEHADVMQITTTGVGEVSAWYVSLWVELAMIVWHRLWLDVSTDVVSQSFIELELQPWRCTLFETIEWSTLIDSSYNAAPTSMHLMIQTTIQLRNQLFADRDIIYCLWDMNELGEFTESEHRKLASTISQSAEHIFLIGPHTHAYTSDELKKIWFSPSRVTMCADAHDLGRQLEEYLIMSPKQFVILCKASQWGLYMEEAIPYVLVDESDVERLPRQEDWWKKRKREAYGRSE